MGVINDYPISTQDTDLWDLFRQGNQTAYTELVRRYAKPLFNYGYRFYQNEALIEDCIQALFHDLWERRERIGATPAVKGYLFKAMRHRVFREQQNWNRHQELDDQYDFLVDFSIESKLIEDTNIVTLNSRVAKVLNELPARHREVLYLRFFEDLDFTQIEQVMSINRQSVHNLLQRAYKSFKASWTIMSILGYIAIRSTKLFY